MCALSNFQDIIDNQLNAESGKSYESKGSPAAGRRSGVQNEGRACPKWGNKVLKC